MKLSPVISRVCLIILALNSCSPKLDIQEEKVAYLHYGDIVRIELCLSNKNRFRLFIHQAYGATCHTDGDYSVKRGKLTLNFNPETQDVMELAVRKTGKCDLDDSEIRIQKDGSIMLDSFLVEKVTDINQIKDFCFGL